VVVCDKLEEEEVGSKESKVPTPIVELNTSCASQLEVFLSSLLFDIG